MDGVQIFNAIEAGWWGLVAIAVSILRIPGHVQWARWWLVGTLILFGVSDIVEIETGAWWRPWWLLVWKGMCVTTMMVSGILLMRGWNRE